MLIDINAPIGVFDSGIGGLSILRHMRIALPYEHLYYFSDNAYIPYGDKSELQIVNRSLTITRFFLTKNIKALVIACNTATARSIQQIRLIYPQLIVIGIEPGLRPAAFKTKTGVIGVLATYSTLTSDSFITLCKKITCTKKVQFISQACIGLADQIENTRFCLQTVHYLIKRYVNPLIHQGADTLVLGCTHYSFIYNLIKFSAQRTSNINITLIDTSTAVTRHLIRLLENNKLQRQQKTTGLTLAYTTADNRTLKNAFQNLLQLTPNIKKMTLEL